jgi:phosphopantothenate synthetase
VTAGMDKVAVLKVAALKVVIIDYNPLSRKLLI